MPASADPQNLNTVIQGGSFATLVFIIVWVARVLIPQVTGTFARALSEQQAKFDAILERQEQRHEREKVRRDAAFEKVAEAQQCTAVALRDVADRLAQVERRTDEHTALFAEDRRQNTVIDPTGPLRRKTDPVPG